MGLVLIYINLRFFYRITLLYAIAHTSIVIRRDIQSKWWSLGRHCFRQAYVRAIYSSKEQPSKLDCDEQYLGMPTLYYWHLHFFFHLTTFWFGPLPAMNRMTKLYDCCVSENILTVGKHFGQKMSVNTQLLLQKKFFKQNQFQILPSFILRIVKDHCIALYITADGCIL